LAAAPEYSDICTPAHRYARSGVKWFSAASVARSALSSPVAMSATSLLAGQRLTYAVARARAIRACVTSVGSLAVSAASRLVSIASTDTSPAPSLSSWL